MGLNLFVMHNAIVMNGYLHKQNSCLTQKKKSYNHLRRLQSTNQLRIL